MPGPAYLRYESSIPRNNADVTRGEHGSGAALSRPYGSVTQRYYSGGGGETADKLERACRRVLWATGDVHDARRPHVPREVRTRSAKNRKNQRPGLTGFVPGPTYPSCGPFPPTDPVS